MVETRLERDSKNIPHPKLGPRHESWHHTRADYEYKQRISHFSGQSKCLSYHRANAVRLSHFIRDIVSVYVQVSYMGKSPIILDPGDHDAFTGLEC